MTCVVGIARDGQVILGGDSASVDEPAGVVNIISNPKVFKMGGFLFGFAESFRLGDVIRYSFTPPPRERQSVDVYMRTKFVTILRSSLSRQGTLVKPRESEEVMPGCLLVGYAGRLFYIGEDFQVSEPEHGFEAIGSGAPAAYGALWATRHRKPEVSVQVALEAASRFTLYVREPFKVVSA